MTYDYRCAIVCHNANGQPDLVRCRVRATREQYQDGQHYEAAKNWAKENGYEGPFIVFDENDPWGDDLYYLQDPPSPTALVSILRKSRRRKKEPQET
jgi:hypothetical protein